MEDCSKIYRKTSFLIIDNSIVLTAS